MSLIDSLDERAGHRIANDKEIYGPVPICGQAVPVSLQQLMRQIENADKDGVANDLVRYANALIESAWNGSMCEKQLGRKIPLSDAILRSRSVQIHAVHAYVERFPQMLLDSEAVIFTEEFDLAKFRKSAHESFHVSSTKNLTNNSPCHTRIPKMTFQSS